MLMLFLLQHNLAKANKYSGNISSTTFINNILAIYIGHLKLVDSIDLQILYHDSTCQEVHCNITFDAKN